MASKIREIMESGNPKNNPAKNFIRLETPEQKNNYLNHLKATGRADGKFINPMKSIANSDEKPLVPDQILPAKPGFLAKLSDVIAGRPSKIPAQRRTENLPSRPYNHTNGPIVAPESRLSKHNPATTNSPQVGDIARSIAATSNRMIDMVERQEKHLLDTARDAALRAPPKVTTVTRTEPGLFGGSRTVTEKIVQPAKATAHVNIQAELPTAHWKRTTVTSEEQKDATFNNNTGSVDFHLSAGQSITHESFDFEGGYFGNNSSFDITY